MSRGNTETRKFKTKFRRSTVLHPNFNAKFQAGEYDYITVPTISTRGSWPVVHMIDQDTFVQMAIVAGHIAKPAKKGKH